MFCGSEHTEGLTTDGDLLAVGLVDDTVDLLEVVGVGDDLVVGDDVLERVSAKCGQQKSRIFAGYAGARRWERGIRAGRFPRNTGGYAP